MKISGSADAFVARPDPKIRAVLIYGPDSGLVRERLNALTRAVAGSTDDPFRVTELPCTTLRDDPARLGDEVAAFSFSGGRRVVRVRDADDSVGDVLGAYLESGTGDALVLVAADELPPRSKLRQAFEAADDAAALACYADSAQTIEGLVRDAIKKAGMQIAPDALAWLADHVGGDRELTRRELEKLVLYVCAPGATISEEDVLACIGDSAALNLDDLIYAVGDGDQATIQRVYGRLMAEGTSPISVLTSVARHFMRLHETRGRLADGKSMDQAAAALRPPVFYKYKGRFYAQAKKWTEALLARALDVVTEAELAAKSTDMPAEAIIERAFLQLAQVGRGAGRKS
ncbi:MAG: DNA polymerase III subunit delta [Rhodospirillaceae bacterium]|nr:DNA polymerase III subunit delta [Rhodospirillaceae bacterium]